MKIVQNALFRSCAARFGQIALVSVKVVKSVTLASNSLQKGTTVRFSWKLYKTLFSDHAQHVLPKSHFSTSKFSKSSHWPEILFKRENSALSIKIVQNAFSRHAEHVLAILHFWGSKLSKSSNWSKILFKKGKQCAFYENCTKRSFQIMRITFLPKSHFWGSNFWKSLHLSQILFKTGKQCAFHENFTKRSFRSCAASFGQIAFLSVKVVKIVTLAWNSL